MSAMERIDKYLWSIRVFKTRTEAMEACRGNKVRIGGSPVKPSKEVKAGDVIEVRKGAVQFKYRVKAFPVSRVGAALVPDYAENLTPQTELDKLKSPVETFFVKRDRGAGRPTKKDRRDIDVLWSNLEDEDGIPDDIARHFGIDDDDNL